MITKELNGLRWLQFELLEGCPIIHACLTRQGGFSQGPRASLNLKKHEDDHEHVQKNIEKVLSTLQIPHFLKPRLCHGTQIISTSAVSEFSAVCDGVSTNTPNLGVLITQGDCQAAIFYDPIRHALANVHCGWRGNVQNIYQSTVDHMKETYQSNVKDLLVCISPSLGPENSEFIHYQKELPELFWKFQPKPTYFDLWEISRWQLEEAGIQSQNIQIAQIDTYKCEEDYFSHRRSKESGRNGTICSLLP